MSIEIVAGYWMAPFAVTVAAWCWARYATSDLRQSPGSYGVNGFISLGYYGFATIIALASWLVWAVLT